MSAVDDFHRRQAQQFRPRLRIVPSSKAKQLHCRRWPGRQIKQSWFIHSRAALLEQESRVSATTLLMVGIKGYDGLTFAIVN